VEEEGVCCGVWDRERVAGETVGDGDGIGEGWVGGDGLDQEEVGAGKGAFLGGVWGALEVYERRQADERGEREPVAGGLFRFGFDGWFAGGVVFVSSVCRWWWGGVFLLVGVMAVSGANGCGEDGAHLQRTEGAGAEGAQGIERGDDGVGVLQEQAAGGSEGEDGAEGSVNGFDLDLAVAGEGCGGF